jgi:hypothetical protein
MAQRVIGIAAARASSNNTLRGLLARSLMALRVQACCPSAGLAGACAICQRPLAFPRQANACSSVNAISSLVVPLAQQDTELGGGPYEKPRPQWRPPGADHWGSDDEGDLPSQKAIYQIGMK